MNKPILAILLIFFIAGTSSVVQGSSGYQIPPKPSAYFQYVNRIFKLALKHHRQVDSYQQYQESLANPLQFQQFLNQTGTAKWKIQTVCTVAEGLVSLDEIYYFHEYFYQHKAIACAQRLLSRYNRFLRRQAQDLLKKQLIKRGAATPLLGPSKEITMDQANTPVTFDANLDRLNISLSFDDGPHPRLTPLLLDILRTENLRVNFYLVGENTQRNQSLVKTMYGHGHEIGCHSMTHPDMRRLKLSDAIKEIESGFMEIFNAIGIHTSNFRFPYGASTANLRKYLDNTYTVEYLWNIDTLDWKHKDPRVLLSYAIEQIKSQKRGIILMHDIQPQTIAILPALIEFLRQSGYSNSILRPKYARRHP